MEDYWLAKWFPRSVSPWERLKGAATWLLPAALTIIVQMVLVVLLLVSMLLGGAIDQLGKHRSKESQ